MQRVLSLLVDNNPGVLSRIAGLFSRRGYNVDSITAGTTADERFTRITIITSGDEQILTQIEKQVSKLEDVVDVKVLDPQKSVFRELILVKIRVEEGKMIGPFSLSEIFNFYHAKVVDVDKDSVMVELQGDQSKLEAFLKILEDFEILELARTGITGLSRGIEGVRMFD